MRGANMFVLVIVVASCAVVGVTVIGNGCRTADDAVDVAHKEFDASALLEKYRYFKRLAASLEARQADIEVVSARAADARATYGVDASAWPRDVREAYAHDRDAVVALKLSFNKMAAEYNAAMADKFRAFTNVGDLPRGLPDGEKTALRREYVTYKVE